jgi:hypothetical protein
LLTFHYIHSFLFCIIAADVNLKTVVFGRV